MLVVVCSGQLKHCDAPSRCMYVPGSHGEHEKGPTTMPGASESVENLPRSHGRHSDWPSSPCREPLGHGSHVSEPYDGARVPAWQLEQRRSVLAPKGFACPGGHGSHTPEKLPPSALASPAWQTSAAARLSPPVTPASESAEPRSAMWCTPTGSGVETPCARVRGRGRGRGRG